MSKIISIIIPLLEFWRKIKLENQFAGEGGETENMRMREKLIWKELSPVIVIVAGKSKIHRSGPRFGNSDRTSMLQSCGRIPFFPGILSFALEAFNWSDEAHPHYEGHGLYMMSANSQC